MRTFVLSLISTLSVFAAPAYAESSIKVGALLCLTGGCAEWGSASKNGLLLARDEINAAGGIMGRPVELIFEDTNEATAAVQAVTAFKKLLAFGDIRFFIGPSWTPAGLALAPVAGKMPNIIMISPSLGVAEFNESAPNLFNTMPHSETATRALSKLAHDRGIKRAAIFSSEQPWESLQAKVFREELTRLGGEIVGFVEPNPDVKDLRTESLRIVSVKPELVFLANLNQEGIASRQLRGLGYKGPFFAALLDQTRIDDAGGALEGAISAQFPESQPSFNSAFQAKFGSKPSASADTAHDALAALAKAISAAGSEEVAKVQDALLRVQFEGASGSIRFDDNGGVIREPIFVKVSNNAISTVAEGR